MLIIVLSLIIRFRITLRTSVSSLSLSRDKVTGYIFAFFPLLRLRITCKNFRSYFFSDFFIRFFLFCFSWNIAKFIIYWMHTHFCSLLLLFSLFFCLFLFIYIFPLALSYREHWINKFKLVLAFRVPSISRETLGGVTWVDVTLYWIVIFFFWILITIINKSDCKAELKLYWIFCIFLFFQIIITESTLLFLKIWYLFDMKFESLCLS